jgi:5-methyltetrahydrofolate--homocysteine methyltransferase
VLKRGPEIVITTVISSQGKEVRIGEGQPTVLIGERINPFGKGPLKDAMQSGEMEPIRLEAIKQVEAGADIQIVSVNAFGIDEGLVFPRVTAEVLKTVDSPLCLESRDPAVLEQALRLGLGKPIISSISGEEEVMEQILPLVKTYHTAVVLLASDEAGIPKDASRRVEIIKSILNRAESIGIPREDILVDCVAESSAVNDQAVSVTLETMARIKEELGVNLVLGASNVSFGLPKRMVINRVFLSLAIQGGLNCAIVDAAKMKPTIMAVDLLLGRDPRARRYTTYCRKLKSASSR